jgi:hypothetical protein
MMGFKRSVVLLLAFIAAGAYAASTSSSVSSNSSASSSTTITGANSDIRTRVLTDTASSTSSTGDPGGTTSSCSVETGDRRCEVSCRAPKVARCAQSSAGRTPRCSCR